MKKTISKLESGKWLLIATTGIVMVSTSVSFTGCGSKPADQSHNVAARLGQAINNNIGASQLAVTRDPQTGQIIPLQCVDAKLSQDKDNPEKYVGTARFSDGTMRSVTVDTKEENGLRIQSYQLGSLVQPVSPVEPAAPTATVLVTGQMLYSPDGSLYGTVVSVVNVHQFENGAVEPGVLVKLAQNTGTTWLPQRSALKLVK